MTLKKAFKDIDFYIDHKKQYEYHIKNNIGMLNALSKDCTKLERKLIRASRQTIKNAYKLYRFHICHFYIPTPKYAKIQEYLKKVDDIKSWLYMLKKAHNIEE